MNPLKYGLFRKVDAQNSGWRRNSAILLGKPRLVLALRRNLREIGIQRTLSGALQLTYHLLYRKDPLQISFLLFGDQCPLAGTDYKFKPDDEPQPYRTSEEYLVLYALLSLMKEQQPPDEGASEANPLSGGGTLQLVFVPDKQDASIQDFRIVTPDEFIAKADISVIGTDENLKKMTKKLMDFFRLESERVNTDTTTRMKLHKMPRYTIDKDSVVLSPSP